MGRQISKEYPEYVWYPEVLANASHSTEFLGIQLSQHVGNAHGASGGLMVDEGNDVRTYIQETIVKDGLGIHDATEKEIDSLADYKNNALLADFTLADMISRRAQIGVCPLPYGSQF